MEDQEGNAAYAKRLIGGNNSIWLNEGNEYHLITSVANLENDVISNNNRMKITTKRQGTISKSLTILFSKKMDVN